MSQHEGRHPIKEVLLSARDKFVFEPTIELISNKQATVQGAKGIIEYTEELIRINLSDQEACFYGNNLSIGCLSQDSLEITGNIERLEYR